ncbi:hypothetical protein OIU77_007065 [Salix suchowensis]|uniref:Uncharacterized protein n=1 Tax=Salix suchowensis TaxID=1278906 RepID=A0ABQ9APV4_9ROSI|nr:hypothetical protein OIU77_007065 [Salix suchowensis]
MNGLLLCVVFLFVCFVKPPSAPTSSLPSI